MNNEKNAAIPLHLLTQQIADVVNHAFASPVWTIAEISDLRHAQNGHCYLQLIEKDPRRGTTLATVRAMVWANRWWLLRDSFMQQTGQAFQNGLKVMLEVQVTMHPQYGLSLQILDFDPTYTLGEMARRRLEILRALEDDGVIDMNRELPFPTLPQRIAVISANEAAGYGDFTRQLHDNAYGLKFYTHLFAATMQGEQTEPSVIAALERIYEHQDLFDCVVIIRGGGATVDLASFDSYALASCIAQFPLPVITGIGHDRDQNVLDRVAHTSVKTPTAAAALLIDAMASRLSLLDDLRAELTETLRERMDHEHQRLQHAVSIVRGTRLTLQQQLTRILRLGERAQLIARQRIQHDLLRLDNIQQMLPRLTQQHLAHQQSRLDLLEQTVHMAQPDLILQRGFSITRLDGHAVRRAADVPEGARLEIQTADGKFEALKS